MTWAQLMAQIEALRLPNSTQTIDQRQAAINTLKTQLVALTPPVTAVFSGVS